MAGMRRREREFDADDMGPAAGGARPPAPGAEGGGRSTAPHPPDDFDRRLAAAGAAVAPLEPMAYRFAPGPGGFVITAITLDDLAVAIPGTTLKWPKV
jgi:hypothetical protein